MASRRQSAAESGAAGPGQPRGQSEAHGDASTVEVSLTSSRVWRRTSSSASGALGARKEQQHPRTVHIHVTAGDSWSDLVVADSPPESAKERLLARRWAQVRRTCSCLTLFVLLAGAAAACVVLPVSLMLRPDAPHQMLEASGPRPSLRLIAAWRADNASHAVAPQSLSALLPPRQRAYVAAETPVPGTPLAILEFDSEASLAAARSVLAANAADAKGGALAYVLRDFPLSPDARLAGPVTTPRQLFDQTWGSQARDDFDSRRRRRALLAAGNSSSGAADAGTSSKGPPAATEQPLSLPRHLQPAKGGLDAPAAWAAAGGGAAAGVVVAVVGSGVEVSHPRLGAAVWANPREVAGNGIDDDGNGLADDAEGWDFGGRCATEAIGENGLGGCARCSPGPDASDTDGWGTHAAALAAGAASNLTGTAGVAPGARLLPLRISDCHSGQMWASHAVEALAYAARAGASVVLAPWADVAGGGGEQASGARDSPAMAHARRRLFSDAIQPLRRAGALLVAPAISSTGAGDKAVAAALLPCSLANETDAVLCIGAAAGAHPGAELSVPSNDLPAAYFGGGHAAMSGATPAAAVGAGAAALVWSAVGKRLGGDFSALGPLVKRILMDTADKPNTRASAPAQKNGTKAAAAPDQLPVLRLGAAVAEAAGPNGTTTTAPARWAVPVLPEPPALSGIPVSVSRPGATLSWHLNQYGATNAAVLQTVLHRAAPSLEVTDWEYASQGAVVLTAVLTAQLPVAAVGKGYRLRVESADPFALWLGGRRLLVIDDARPGVGGAEAGPGGRLYWTAGVDFTEPGNYTISAMIFRKANAPTSSRFNVDWRRPGTAAFEPLPALQTHGRRPARAGADGDLLMRSAAALRSGMVDALRETVATRSPKTSAGAAASEPRTIGNATQRAKGHKVQHLERRRAQKRRRALQQWWAGSWDPFGGWEELQHEDWQEQLQQQQEAWREERERMLEEQRTGVHRAAREQLRRQQEEAQRAKQQQAQRQREAQEAEQRRQQEAAKRQQEQAKRQQDEAKRQQEEAKRQQSQAPEKDKQQEKQQAAEGLAEMRRLGVVTRIDVAAEAAAAEAARPPGSVGLAVAFTARPQTSHTILLPSQALGLPLERGGALPSLDFTGEPWKLQRALLGAGGPADGGGVGAGATQEALGSARGWLDVEALLGLKINKSSDAGGFSEAVVGPAAPAPPQPRRGVQFEIACERCWLLLDGAVVAGTRDGPQRSPCVELPLPPQQQEGGAGASGDGGMQQKQQAGQHHFAHLELQFVAKSLPVAGLSVRRRACTPGANPVAPDAASFEPLGTALAPGWVLSPADLAAGGYREGLVCEVALAGQPESSEPQPVWELGVVPRAKAERAAATVFVPRRPGAAGAGGLDPASATRFTPRPAGHSSTVAFGDAAVNASATVAVQTPPDEASGGELEEEERREREVRKRQAAAAAASPQARQPAPQLPPPGSAGDDALAPLVSFLNGLLSTWWGGRQLRAVAPEPAAQLPSLGAAAAAPLESHRTLLAADGDAPSAAEGSQPRTGRVLSLSAARLAPALVSAHGPGALYDVACFAYWNGTFAGNASIGADPSGAVRGASIRAGGARLASRAASPTLIAGIGVESELTAWEEQRDQLQGAGYAAPGGGVDLGLPDRRGPGVAGGAYAGGDAGLLRLLVLEWRGAAPDAALWVADSRGPWELEPRALWVPAGTGRVVQ